MHDTYLIGVVITSLIILVIFLIIAGMEYTKYSIYSTMMDGYWTAPPTFCKRADIVKASAFLQQNSIYLLIISTEGNIVLNKCVNFTSSTCYLSNYTQDFVEYEIEFDEPVDPLPQAVTMRVTGNDIKFYNDETLYLELKRGGT